MAEVWSPDSELQSLKSILCSLGGVCFKMFKNSIDSRGWCPRRETSSRTPSSFEKRNLNRKFLFRNVEMDLFEVREV